MLKLKRKFLIIIFLVTSIFTSVAAPTVNFLPLEDEMSSTRNSVYGASIENTKPFRQAIAVTAPTIPSYSLGIKDVWALGLLVGVYFFFTRKRSNARSVGF